MVMIDHTTSLPAKAIKIPLQFKIEKIITDNGIEFNYNLLLDGKQPKTKTHPFGKICQE